MAQFQGEYSRRPSPSSFESKRYLGVQQEASTNASRRHWIDADWNEFVLQMLRNMQRMAQRGFGDGSPDNGFNVIEAFAPANNFTLQGGDAGANQGDVEASGRMWVGGLPALLEDDIDYTAQADVGRIHAKSTALAATVLTDTSSRWVVNELKNRKLVPDATNPANSYVIKSNTATTITIADGGDMVGDGAEAGDHYYVTLTQPAVARTDTVYLDVYLDEIDVSEDPDLDHGASFGAAGQRLGATRLKLITRVLVNEGGKGHHVPSTVGASNADLFRKYQDSNGEDHWITPIATLARTAGQDNITTAMITDDRAKVWGVQAVRDGLVGPDHTAKDLKRRFDEVRPYITVGDGTTTFGDYNGESGLRAALAAAPSGSTVYIKRGTYTLTAEADITTNIHVVGESVRDSPHVRIIKAAGKYALDIQANGGSVRNLEIDCSDDAFNGVRILTGHLLDHVKISNIGKFGVELLNAADVRIENCKFASDQSAGGIEYTAPATADAVIEGCTFSLTGADLTDYGIVVKCGTFGAGITVSNCHFRSGRGGVYVQAFSSTGMRIEGCRFDAALVDLGVRFDEGNLAPVIEGCWFDAAIGTGCVLMDAIGAGITTNPRLVGNWFGAPTAANPWVDLRKVRNALVSDNVFAGATASAMLFVDTLGEVADDKGSVISGNAMDGGGVATIGISVGTNHEESSIVGNRVRDVVTGISVTSPGCVIDGNQVQECTDGIVLGAAAHDCSIAGNVVGAASGDCIDLGTADRIAVNGNRCWRAGGGDRELQMTGSTKCSVMGNNFSQSDGSLGEIKLDSADNTVRDNRAKETLERDLFISGLTLHDLRNNPNADAATYENLFANGGGVVNGDAANNTKYVGRGLEGLLPQGCFISKLEMYTDTPVIAVNNSVTVSIERHAFADGARTQVTSLTATQLGIEQLSQNGALNLQVDHDLGSWILVVELDTTQAQRVKLYRVRIKYKAAS